jgi:hypothetical protein
VGAKRSHAQAFDGQVVHPAEAADQLPASAGRLGFRQVLGQAEGGMIEGGVAGLDGGQGEAEGDVRLAGARRPYEEQAAALGDEANGGQLR